MATGLMDLNHDLLKALNPNLGAHKPLSALATPSLSACVLTFPPTTVPQSSGDMVFTLFRLPPHITQPLPPLQAPQHPRLSLLSPSLPLLRHLLLLHRAQGASVGEVSVIEVVRLIRLDPGRWASIPPVTLMDDLIIQGAGLDDVLEVGDESEGVRGVIRHACIHVHRLPHVMPAALGLRSAQGANSFEPRCDDWLPPLPPTPRPE